MTAATVVPAETATEITAPIPVITDNTPPPQAQPQAEAQPQPEAQSPADAVEPDPTEAADETGEPAGAVDAAPAGPGEQTTPATPATVVVGAESAPVSLNQHTKTWAEQLRTNWTPPDLWNHGRPSLKASWLWAIKGEHLPDDQRMRTASRAATGALIPFRALFLGLDWIFERMSRVVAALVLVIAVIQMIHPMF